MRGDEESESRLVATERADDVITSIERDVENMERVEFLTPGSDDDKQFELEMKRERIYGRERVSGDTGGVDSLLHSNPEKAEKKKSQKRTRVTRRPRPVPNQLHVNNSFDDTDSSISEAQEVLMSKEGLFISQNEPPSSSEENVCCTEATLLHQTPQKMLLEGYGEEPAAVENWEVRQALKLLLFIYILVCVLLAAGVARELISFWICVPNRNPNPNISVLLCLGQPQLSAGPFICLSHKRGICGG